MRHAIVLVVLSLSTAWVGSARAEVKECIARNNQGADEQAKHHLLAARENYLACASATDCPTMVRKECQDALAELKGLIPSLVVAVVDEHGRDVSLATLTLDGKPVAHDGTTLELDPGPHQLVAEFEGRRAALDVVASESDVGRRVELAFAAPVVAPAAPVVAPPPAPEKPQRSHVPSYVLGGVGVLAAGSFATFALSGHSGMSDLDRCKPYCPASDVRSVQTKYLIADISLGVSLVSLAAATYLWLRPEPAASTERAALHVDVLTVPRGAALGLTWSN